MSHPELTVAIVRTAVHAEGARVQAQVVAEKNLLHIGPLPPYQIQQLREARQTLIVAADLLECVLGDRAEAVAG